MMTIFPLKTVTRLISSTILLLTIQGIDFIFKSLNHSLNYKKSCVGRLKAKVLYCENQIKILMFDINSLEKNGGLEKTAVEDIV